MEDGCNDMFRPTAVSSKAGGWLGVGDCKGGEVMGKMVNIWRTTGQQIQMDERVCE